MTSTHKTSADAELILSFLKESFSDRTSDLEVIAGGEGSQAYGFSVDDSAYVIRVNKHHSLGFRKDEYAHEHYSSSKVPVPKICKIGKMEGELRFCISERAPGRPLSAFREEERQNSWLLESVFNVLDAIHAMDIRGTEGYGKWDAEGKGANASWKERLLSVDEYAKQGLFETTFLEREFWDKAYVRLSELQAYCPEERFLVHGDFGFGNLLYDGQKLTGVIDWEASMYGDFLYDIAWLSFWSANSDIEQKYEDRSKEKGIILADFSERILCYKLYIGLSSLSFYAYSGQEEKYRKSKAKMELLLSA